ncbi:Pisatin demethylase [Lasiodiplodia theobromae]|uniref:Cytochrome P450 monooxygenase gsfF n=1 Tax=Lasiodiplodia theobromae TaxID=45133 RepID=A0A5N5D6J5_9PEZI|nr:Pisatin demethylase [Lasiodiplodia theobromae]KAB2573396.1 Cytochrome P450 monooxygenase gsfF [Lasiodiplodia theobromae]KAF4546145.1 Pisatin demethylase [Lasiodiplodia theobromae]
MVDTLRTRFFHLNVFQGPSWAAYTRLWLCKTLASGSSAQIFVDVNKKYGPVARIGPNNLVTDDPEFVRRILAARSHYTRGPWFDSIKIDPHVSNIVSERHPGRHNHLRYQMSAGYAGKDISGLESTVNERISTFIRRIEDNWLSTPEFTKRFDIAKRIQYLAVDIITHLAFGKPLGFGEADADLFNFLSTIEMQLPIVQHFSVILELNDLLAWVAKFKWLRRFIVPSSKDKKGIGMIMGISHEVIKKRFGPSAEKKKDMLGSFISRGLDADEVEMEISISLVAGSDTTATAMRSTLLSIISTPHVYSRLRQEIDDAISRGEVSSPITEEEAKRLPYLQAVLKEGLRRFPPITQLRERMVPPEGDWYDGKHIPAGTFVGLNAWGLQLNRVFGDDPEIFRPERWLIDDQDRLRRMGQVQELIFGHGTTKCLGIPIAMMTLNKIFVELLRRFDVQVMNPHRPWTSICYGIFFQKDFNVRITRRDDSIEAA